MPKKPLIEEENELEWKPEFKFVPGKHIYRQEGPYLVCRECELHHAVYIGMDHIMVGEENGKPIIRKRSELNES